MLRALHMENAVNRNKVMHTHEVVAQLTRWWDDEVFEKYPSWEECTGAGFFTSPRLVEFFGSMDAPAHGGASPGVLNYSQCAKYGIGREVISKMLEGTETENNIKQALASLPLTARRKQGLELQAEEERRKAEELRAEADRINAEREQSRIAAPQNLSPKIRLFFAQSDFYPAATYPQSAGQHLYRTTFVVLYWHEKPTHCP